MIKKIVVIISIFTTLVCICMGCGKDTKIAREHGQQIADIVESGDMEKINEFVFGYQETEADEKIAAIMGTTEKEEDGILKEIFQNNTFEITEVSKDKIKYEIKAPDLTEVFERLGEADRGLSEEEFTEEVRKYIEQAKYKKRTVSVPYKVVDGEVIVNYRNEEFINAITGGLLENYQKFYRQMLEEYEG